MAEFKMRKIKVDIKQLSIALSRDILLPFFALVFAYMSRKIFELCFGRSVFGSTFVHHFIANPLAKLNKLEGIWLAPSIKLAVLTELTPPLIGISEAGEALSEFTQPLCTLAINSSLEPSSRSTLRNAPYKIINFI